MDVSIRCKEGKIEIKNGLLQVKQFSKILFETPTADVTGLTAQPGQTVGWITALTVTIQTGKHGYYVAETVKEDGYAKLQTAFPDVVSQRAGGEWYHSPAARTHVETYTNEKAMQREVEMAGQFGWIPQGTSSTASHINVGRTVAKAVVFSPLSLVTGASRSKGKITITYVRSQEWLAQH